jgi:hypothetical protein
MPESLTNPIPTQRPAKIRRRAFNERRRLGFLPGMKLQAFLLLSLLFASACTGSYSGVEPGEPPPNAGPTLEVVAAPAGVTAERGVYRIPLSLSVVDPEGDDVVRLRYRVPSVGIDVAQDVTIGPEQDVVFMVDGRAPKRTYELVLTAFDALGVEGPPVTQSITLE